MTVGLIDIDIVGGRRSVEKLLLHLESSLSDVGMRLFLSGRVAPWLRERAEDRFKGEGDDAVGHWKQLSEATQNFRESYGFSRSNPINKRTGELEDFIINAPSKVTTTAGFASLLWPESSGNPVVTKKLRTAQTGATSPRTPSRPVLGLSEVDLTHVLTQLALHVQGWSGSMTP